MFSDRKRHERTFIGKQKHSVACRKAEVGMGLEGACPAPREGRVVGVPGSQVLKGRGAFQAQRRRCCAASTSGLGAGQR